MTKYVNLINLRLGSFVAWRLEHVPRNSNEKADALAAVAASLPIKETVLLPLYYQSESLITTNRVNEIDETGPSWITLIARYLSWGNCQIAELKCHARWISVRPDWRIRIEVRGMMLSILYTIYYTVLGLSLTCPFSELYLFLWYTNNFCNNKNHLTYTKNYHRSGVHHNLYTYTESHLLIHVQFLYKTLEIAEAALVSTYL